MSLQFENPMALWGFLPVAIFGAIMIRRGITEPASFSKSRACLILFGFAFAVLGFSRPQGGNHVTAQSVVKSNLFVMVDISQSMTAEDISPSRLEFAAIFCEKLLEQFPIARVAVFPFTVEGYIQIPLTTDVPAISDALHTLSPGQTTFQGTDLTRAMGSLLAQLSRIEQALDKRGEKGIPTQVLLLSDGESHHPLDREVLQAFHRKKIPVFTVGIGTAAGTQIPVQTRYVRERFETRTTQMVTTRLHAETLRQISDETGGDYFRSRFEEVSPLATRLKQAVQIGKLTASFKVEQEFYPLLFFLSFLLFAIEFSTGRWEYAIRVGLIALLTSSAFFSRCADADEVDIKPSADDELHAVQSYNSGVKELATDLSKAIDHFQEAANLTQDPELKKKALFNLGDAILKSGDPAQAIDVLEEAMNVPLKDKKSEKEINSRASDNLVLANRILKQMQQQQGDGKDQKEKDEGGRAKESHDPKGPRKQYQAQMFNDAEKKKIFDLISGDEQQTIRRLQEEKNRKRGSDPNEKPW